MTVLGFVGTVNAIAVDLPRFRTGQIAVPDLVDAAGKLQPLFTSVAVEKAKLHLGRVAREDGEVHAVPVECRAEGKGSSQFQCHPSTKVASGGRVSVNAPSRASASPPLPTLLPP